MPEKIAVIPEPVRWSLKDGQFTLSASSRVVAEGAAAEVADWFVHSLVPALGFMPEVIPSASAESQGLVCFHLDPALKPLGPEGYRLSVSPQRVDFFAAEPAGLFYAAQTFRQLLPPQIFNPQPVPAVEWSLPCIEIEDYPRFAWRGAMLDVGRHFMPLEFVLKFIDLLALHKLNVFQWHLTEDQGWRIEIKKYPRLTEVGAWRKETVAGRSFEESQKPSFDGIPHGGFYTQDQIRLVVEYARRRFIRVVPEIEMPGHSQAAIASYPNLGNTGWRLEVSTHWGVHEHVYSVEEGTIRTLQDVLDEVLALFPSQFIHIGGDEVPKNEWKQIPAAQARLRQLGLKDENELQSWFVRRMDEFLTRRGRRLVGWDEILEGGLAPGATVMSWRGVEGGITAANAGHDVVMAPYTNTYFDYYQTQEEPVDTQVGTYLPLEKVYGYEPVPAAVDVEKARHILGIQGQLWTEFMPDSARVEYMAFPRLCALAEVGWTPGAKKDFALFLPRLKVHLGRLDELKVNYCRKTR